MYLPQQKHYLLCFKILLIFIFIKHLSSTLAFGEIKSTFDVGLAIPLTGNAADYGVAIKNCIELATKDRPELFTNVRFHYEDASYDPKLAVIGFNRLVDVEKVDLAVTWGVSFCKALAPIAESRKVPLMGLCIDPETGANKRYVMRFMNVTDEFMQVMAEYLHRHGMQKLGLLVAEHPYLEEMTAALKRNLFPGQTVTIMDSIPNTETELRTYIIKLKNSDFDSVGVFLFAGQISVFYKQAKQLKLTKPTFGTNFFESLSELHASNGSMIDSVFTSIEIKPDFLKRYKSHFGDQSQLAFGAPAYEFALTIGELFNQNADEISKEEIIKSFSSITSRDGVAAGPYTYVKDPKVGQYFRFPVVAKRVISEGFEVVY